MGFIVVFFGLKQRIIANSSILQGSGSWLDDADQAYDL